MTSASRVLFWWFREQIWSKWANYFFELNLCYGFRSMEKISLLSIAELFYRDTKFVCRIGPKNVKMHVLKTDSYNKNKYHGPTKLTVLNDFHPSLMNQ